MSESVRQRVRDILEPFLAQSAFEIEPGASDAEIDDECDRLRLERLPAAVDEF